MTYKAQAGTIPCRAIEHLKSLPPGAQLPNAVLADFLDCDKAALHTSLITPTRHGAIGREKKADGLVYWSLGTGVPEAKPDDYEPDEPLHPRSEVVPRPGRKRRGGAFDHVGVEPGGQVPLFGAFSDGRLNIQADGHDLKLSAESTTALRRFLREWGGPIE